MKGYRIKTVARVTGLSPEVLRAWERRYGVVRPSRTPGGYREYSEADVERLRMLRVLTARGWTIGEIAGHSTLELDRLVQQLREQSDQEVVDAPPGHHAALIEQLIALAAELDAFGLRRALRRALVLLPTREVAGEVLLPMLRELAQRAARHRRYRAGLELARAEIAGFAAPLGADLPADAPVALVATGPQEVHGGELLLALLRCLHHGWQVVLAGLGTEPRDQQEMVRVGGASLVVLTFETPIDLGSFLALVDSWSAMLPPACRLLICGHAVERFSHAATERGAHFAVDEAALGGLLSAE